MFFTVHFQINNINQILFCTQRRVPVDAVREIEIYEMHTVVYENPPR